MKRIDSDVDKLLSMAIKGVIKKPCLFMSFWSSGQAADVTKEFEVLGRDIGFLSELSRDEQLHLQGDILNEGHAVVVCEDEEELDRLYDTVKGDDHGGEVYATTFDADGQAMNENT